MNFLVDAQPPPALARWIVSQGHQATHVFDIGLQTADDPVIWERARSENTVIISKDEDFVDHWLLSAEPVQLVWIRKGNCSNRALLDLARTALARRREAIGAGREVHRVAGVEHFARIEDRLAQRRLRHRRLH